MKAIVLKSVFVMAFGATSFTTAHAEHQGHLSMAKMNTHC